MLDAQSSEHNTKYNLSHSRGSYVLNMCVTHVYVRDPVVLEWLCTYPLS